MDNFFVDGNSNVIYYDPYWVDIIWCLLITKLSTTFSKNSAQLPVYFRMPYMWVTTTMIYFFPLKLTTMEYLFGHGKSNINVYDPYWVNRTWCLVTTKLYTICSNNSPLISI